MEDKMKHPLAITGPLTEELSDPHRGYDPDQSEDAMESEQEKMKSIQKKKSKMLSWKMGNGKY